MFQPILEAMTLCLEEANPVDLVDLLPQYVLFRVGMGMLQPRRIDDVWDKESVHYNAYMAELFPSRRQFYVLQRLADPDADALIELCTMHWQGGWELGDVVCGDETVVPHKGLFVIRQFIPRKPHSTGVKLYGCATHKAITFGMCICTVVQPLVWVQSPGAGLQATTMLLRLCNFGMM